MQYFFRPTQWEKSHHPLQLYFQNSHQRHLTAKRFNNLFRVAFNMAKYFCCFILQRGSTLKAKSFQLGRVRCSLVDKLLVTVK